MIGWKRAREHVIAFADGAIGDGRGPAGVGAVLLDDEGCVLRLDNRRVPRMTNNEAEYAGLLLALELALEMNPQCERLTVYLDSDVVVGQMVGRYAVRSQDLKPMHSRACQLARRLKRVQFYHVPREQNQLADALANEALQGKHLQGPAA
jgi:ribonuclease HI